jgi:hypothetical protein
MQDRKAHLAEIEENARQQGFALAMAQRPILEKTNGQMTEEVCDAMIAEQIATFNRLCAEMRKAGATGKEMKRYMRGLHAGMKAGNAEVYKPFIELEKSGG